VRFTTPWLFGGAMALGCTLLPSALAHSPDEAVGKTYVLNARALPLGDGKVSARPQRGYVFACQSNFRGGGAQRAGDWITGSVWDSTRKIYVRGAVAWPAAEFAVRALGARRQLTGNALPTNHATGTFPVSRDDPAYQLDRNPNAIAPQNLAWSLPLIPTRLSEPGCVPMGQIGVMLNGVAIFNALDAAGKDAVANEVQDACNGHPERDGKYHYHGSSSCLPAAQGNNTLVGYAADGFGIYSMFDATGRELTNADLDECHGRTSRVAWDGKEVEIYHYVLTREYPYSVGCLRGSVAVSPSSDARPDAARAPMGQQTPPGDLGPGGRRPPAEAIQACSSMAPGASCKFVSPRGDNVVGSCRNVGDVVACAPQRP
jgi:hypothetical protein